MPQMNRPEVPTLGGAKAAGSMSDVDVDQQLVIESAGGDCLPDDPLPDDPLPDIPLPNVSHPDDPLAEACPDGSVGEE